MSPGPVKRNAVSKSPPLKKINFFIYIRAREYVMYEHTCEACEAPAPGRVRRGQRRWRLSLLFLSTCPFEAQFFEPRTRNQRASVIPSPPPLELFSQAFERYLFGYKDS